MVTKRVRILQKGEYQGREGIVIKRERIFRLFSSKNKELNLNDSDIILESKLNTIQDTYELYGKNLIINHTQKICDSCKVYKKLYNCIGYAYTIKLQDTNMNEIVLIPEYNVIEIKN